jgi:WD40 repeat protein
MALAVVVTAMALLWWESPEQPNVPTLEEPSSVWTEVEAAPLTEPDHDPLPPGAILRLGRERLRQRGFSARLRPRDGSSLLTFSPDKKLLASVEQPGQAVQSKRVIHLWGLPTGREIRRLERFPAELIEQIQFSGDGRKLLVLDERMLCILEVDTGKEVHRLQGPWDPEQSTRPILSSDGKAVAWMTGPPPYLIHLCDTTTGEELCRFAISNHEYLIRFADGSNHVVIGDPSHHAVRVWDAATGSEIRRLPLSERTSFSTDGTELLGWSRDGPISCWEVMSGREIGLLENPHPGWTTTVVLSAKARTVAAGYTEGTIRWWDITSGRQMAEVHAHPFWVWALAFSEDGKVLASQCGGDGAIHLWDLATGRRLNRPEGHQAAITSLSIAPDGRTIATVGEDHTLRLWSVATGQELIRVRTIGSAVAFAPDGKAVAISGDGERGHRPGTVWLLDPATGTKLRSFEAVHAYPFRTLVFSPDGRRLAGGGRHNCVWDVATGEMLHEFPGDLNLPVAFSPDGRKMAVSAETIRLGDRDGESPFRRFGEKRVSTPPEWLPFPSQQPGFPPLAFSPNGELIAALEEVQHAGPPDPLHTIPPPDGVIRIYQVATGKDIRVLRGHRGPISSVQFSPDGNTLVSGGEDGTVRLWNAMNGKELQRFEGHRDAVTSVAFAPDGQAVISGSRDSTALIWDIKPLKSH